ncbi:hypothetical protein ORI89_06150 [Sphingobacterium sp. UT-1RO-CII-1]|uniref:hypothetical protein n=1 Tax=Sphingobacterium sp. UT-1RO-CII-1 TaxID=2995225 RepID=UPI00227A9629|nr:hypothetical protein [Sphingobacterium sp. UT-1RO-CII-1]MCY4779223.1 hypothetical protein [Sphingobacterium sp. UT-1RO-CII-1]
MRTLITLALFFSFSLANGQNLEMTDIRRDFKIGHKDKDLCQRYLKELEEHANSSVERGYEAAYHMFMANHTGNPFKKMSYFKSGRKMLEEAIQSDQNSVELRYIRLCIQYYIPSYLGYKGNVEEDKRYLTENLYKLRDDSVKDLIYNYLKGAKMYSDEELKLLGR